MLKRYPHIAQMILKSMTVGLDSGIIGEDSSKEETIRIRGRFSNKSGFDGSYTAKFYCVNDQFLPVREKDEATFIFEKREYNVVRILPGQTHTEIWLN